MFYSGWNFSSPQRMIVSGNQQNANCHVQDTGSPGISFIQFFPPVRHGSAPHSRHSDGTGERIHVKSDVPIHPHSGVFYFEVEIRAVEATASSSISADVSASAAAASASASAAGGSGNSALAEPALVIGICRGGLPPHKLPGEEANSIGLFTAQRMVYANGKSEGEAVRLPTGQRRTKGMKVDDAVGCIVNLMDGTVRFTCNGEVLGVVSLLGRRTPRNGYFPAVGVLRLTTALSLRVVLQPLGRVAIGASVARGPLPGVSTAAAGYFVFDIDKYCEGIADEFVKAHKLQVRKRGAEDLVGWDGDEREDTESGAPDGQDADQKGMLTKDCKCHDGNIIAAIRKHLASRGLTKALSAFEKEQAELCCSDSAESGNARDVRMCHHDPLAGEAGVHWQEEEEEEEEEGKEKKKKKKSSARHDSSSLLSTKAASTETSPQDGKLNNNESTSHDNGNNGKSTVAGESRNIAYSVHIRHLREDISRGDMLSSTRRILEEGVLFPLTQSKICSFVERANELPPSFWGLIFFAQRCDILFLLRAAHIIEMALVTMRDSLCELQHLFLGDGTENNSWKNSDENQGENEETTTNNNSSSSSRNKNKKQTAEHAACVDNEAIGASPLSASVDIMELAFRLLLEPFEELSLAARRHRRATAFSAPNGNINSNNNNNSNSSGHVRTAEEIAFGVLHEDPSADEPRGASEDLAAHLFFSGGTDVWADPAAPVTLLVRRSVPRIPPPRASQQRTIVQAISMLVTHLRAVRAHVEENLSQRQRKKSEGKGYDNGSGKGYDNGSGKGYDNGNGAQRWVDNWVALIDAARAQHRARCWRLLLHAIEDFNGALEYRLFVWLRRHQQALRRAEGGGEGNGPQRSDSGCGRRLFPSLRAAWRNVHASAALEPLLHVITRAFSDKLNRAAGAVHLDTTATGGRAVPMAASYAGGRKSGLSIAFDLGKCGADDNNETEESKEGDSAGDGESNLCYTDDIRLSCLYMRKIYNAVFA